MSDTNKTTIQVKKRSSVAAKALRREGFLPAVLYGAGVKATSLQASEREFDEVYREAGRTTMIDLDMEGKKYKVLIYDVQHDPISGKYIHADFYKVDLKKEIEAEVPLVFVGKSMAVKEMGGILVKTLDEIEVKALPQALPHELKVEISPLKTFDDVVKVGDIKIPDGVEILAESEDVVATVSPPRTEEELKELEEAPEETVEDVEATKEKAETEEGEEGVVEGEVKEDDKENASDVKPDSGEDK